MKIAMIGQKGVPALHGGVERHVEELGAALVELGHEVTVFTRPSYTDVSCAEHRGMRLVSLPTIGTKHLDAIVHSLVASLAVWRGGFDVVHYHAIGPCLVSPLARLRGRTVVATVHGQDWQRGKWGGFASAVLRLGEWMALHVPARTICVSQALTRLYRDSGSTRVVWVPNGVVVATGDDTSVLSELGVSDGRFLLFAGRIVPEKGLHHLLAAYERAEIEFPLVVAGDTSGSDDYLRALRQREVPGVIWAGYQYGDRLASLFRHTALFVLPSELEGLPIVLLEAAAFGAPVLASDIEPNQEILGSSGAYFRTADVDDLAGALKRSLADLPALRDSAEGRQAQVLADYDWRHVAAQTEAVYREAIGAR